MAKGKDAKGKGKTMKGKSVVQEPAPVYKPSIWFDNGNLPASLKDAKPGTQISLTVTGRITSRTENAKGVSNLQFEIGKVNGGKGKR